MTSAAFSGDSRYTAVLAASRSGFTVNGSLTVTFSGGSGAWSNDPVQGWASSIGSSYTTGTWTYDFRNYTSRLVWSRGVTMGSPGSYSVGGWADMADGKGRGYPANMSVTIPPNAPAAPTSLNVVRVSDTSQTVTWNRAATAAAPYHNQYLQRAEYADGVWSAWTTVSTITTDYSNAGSHSVNNATVAGKMYRYRVKASNSSGDAYSSTYNYVYTTPVAPTAVAAVKNSSGSITITVTIGTKVTFYNTPMEYSLDGGSTWTALTTLAEGVTSYTWASPPTGSAVLFRARHTIVSSGDPGNGLSSSWKNSNSVALTAPPNAPSNLSPNGIVYDADSAARTFTWKHNPVDSSSQSAYEIQYRIGAAAWTSTGKITSGVSQRIFPAGTFVNGNVYEWQVRTYGAHATASPWSPSATFTTSAPPGVAITSPDGLTPLGVSVLLLEWTFDDPEGTAQSLWEAQLLNDAGQLLEARNGSGATFSVLFATRLADAAEYTVLVRGRDGTALWSEWDQVVFTTDFPAPATPLITSYGWNPDTGAAMLTIDNPDGAPDVTSNTLLRSLDEGQTWETVNIAPPDGNAFDYTLPLGMDVQYKVVAWTDLPSSSESAVVTINSEYIDGVYVGPIGGYWSAGENFSQVIKMDKGKGGPPKMDLTSGLAARTLHYFAGRPKPVETVGEYTSREGEVEFLVSNVFLMRQARDMAMLPAPHLIRLPDGTVLFGSIDEVEDTRVQNGWYEISFNITEVDQ